MTVVVTVPVTGRSMTGVEQDATKGPAIGAAWIKNGMVVTGVKIANQDQMEHHSTNFRD